MKTKSDLPEIYHLLRESMDEVERLAAKLRRTPSSPAAVTTEHADAVALLRSLAEVATAYDANSNKTQEQQRILDAALRQLDEPTHLAAAVALEDDAFLERAMAEFLQQSATPVVPLESSGDAATAAVPLESSPPPFAENVASTSAARRAESTASVMQSTPTIVASSSASSSASSPAARSLSTPAASSLPALARLCATDSPSLFREVLELERLNQQKALELPSRVLSASTRVMFASEARRWLELAHAASADSRSVLLERSRLADEHIVDFELVSTVFRPAFFTCFVPELRAVVLSIRSTKSLTDLMTDYNYEPDTFLQGAAHGGMARAARWFAAHIGPRLAVMLEMYPNTRLRLVGHSLGAGVATLLCLLLRSTPVFRDVECVAFAPPACASSELSALASTCVTSVVNGDDFLPFMSFQHTSIFSQLLSPIAALGRVQDDDAQQPAATSTTATGTDFVVRTSTGLYPTLGTIDEFYVLDPSAPQMTPAAAAEVERVSMQLNAATLSTSQEILDLRKRFFCLCRDCSRERPTTPTNKAAEAEEREAHSRRTFVVAGQIWHMRRDRNHTIDYMSLEAGVPARVFASFPRISLDTIRMHRKVSYFDSIDALMKE
jgi:pimeloyl-ACP methyl ester carboxylesterase